MWCTYVPSSSSQERRPGSPGQFAVHPQRATGDRGDRLDVTSGRREEGFVDTSKIRGWDRHLPYGNSNGARGFQKCRSGNARSTPRGQRRSRQRVVGDQENVTGATLNEFSRAVDQQDLIRFGVRRHDGDTRRHSRALQPAQNRARVYSDVGDFYPCRVIGDDQPGDEEVQGPTE